MSSASAPLCAGLSVVELAVGTSELGFGAAAGVPGMILAGLGAEVVRVVGEPVPIDAEVPWGRVWHRHKRIVRAERDETAALLRAADVALVYGSEEIVEGRGLGYRDLAPHNAGLIYARCRPSRTSGGAVADYGLAVEARAGFCTQLSGHRPGPIFVDARAAAGGTASLLLTSVFALLGRRARTGAGGWAETSLYDGLLATLGCMIGRSERAAADVEYYWEHGSTFPNFLYRCADGELLQVWFGGKGMYEAVIRVLGDEPSAEGYYTDQMTGKLGDRARRWTEFFATRPRADWVERLRAAGVACEPVLGPGEVLADPHLAEIGLSATESIDGREIVTIGNPIRIRARAASPDAGLAASTAESAGRAVESAGRAAESTEPGTESAERAAEFAEPGTESAEPAAEFAGGVAESVPNRSESAALPAESAVRAAEPAVPDGDVLAGLKVVDFSAFVAGPLAAEILADLGADVIKVEPPDGEAMRAAAYAVAACQRGKRSLALDLNAPGAGPVVERLLAGADVVVHNFRVGVAERLGIGEDTVARLNPRAVYCHASAFGAVGPRAKAPGNDALMQAVTGFERAIGGAGNDPIAATWIPLDMAGGWLAAAGTLAGLYGRAAHGHGYGVVTSLLAAGMLPHSGVYLSDGEPVRGPALDAAQTGYGPGYRLYAGSDGEWFALVVPDHDGWRRLTELPEAAGLPGEYAPLRGGAADAAARAAEPILERAFATAPAAVWAERLRGLGLLAEPVEPLDRDGFRRAVLDDPVNRQQGRVLAYRTADWGFFEQIGPLLRYGPAAAHGPRPMLPGIGEHSTEVLTELGFSADEVEQLLAAKVARQSDAV
ncbi:CoA transferase [Nocardia aurantia]|uniref:Formyl-CoA:oxalate CoA-transferase n=1 Tax=Nocardia aurantia TaxID=2585199 RepID=A0A7K0DK80_9NOCA|nr:CoA transferase [Nocardia aurantia]MQY26206.1 Formyl-CoA:oxalate CoA-transferase [Nocardia aurantia]